jgi:hypothetical protein
MIPGTDSDRALRNSTPMHTYYGALAGKVPGRFIFVAMRHFDERAEAVAIVRPDPARQVTACVGGAGIIGQVNYHVTQTGLAGETGATLTQQWTVERQAYPHPNLVGVTRIKFTFELVLF